VIKKTFLLLSIAAAPFAAEAAPQFAGVKQALPAPEAAVLSWDAAKGSGEITYKIYAKERNGWNLQAPVAEVVQVTEWPIVGLPGGQPCEFLVRASDSTGEDQNTKSVTVTPQSNYPDTEWRAVWFTRFEWPSGSKAEVQKRISDAMAAWGAANLNAVIFQVRGQGDTLYPSQDEPWSPLLSQDARTFDPVAFAIEEAHKNGLQFHAWLNLSTIWQSGKKELPADKTHPVYRFADASNPGASSGLIHDAQGKPKQWGSNNYVWLTPGNPAVNAYLRKQVIDFVQKYEVEGLHWDDNTANPNGVSKDPISVQRFNGRGNPMQVKDFGVWQRDQLTRMISNIYVQAKAVQPGLLVTASPFGIEDRNRIPGYGGFSDSAKFGTTPEDWMNFGVVDALTPQVYWGLNKYPPKAPNYATLVKDWMAHNKSGRPIWPGSNIGTGQDLIPWQQRNTAYCRAMGLGGVTLFSYSKAPLQTWRTDGPKIFPNKAKVPVPEHMRNNNGAIMGFVGGADRQAEADVWVKLDGRDYVYLSSGDGFYGIPHVPAGTHTLFFKGVSDQLVQQSVNVEPGKTAVVNLVVP
jgi:uncharacterized lipoprotein YddW (UPF0748 family)